VTRTLTATIAAVATLLGSTAAQSPTSQGAPTNPALDQQVQLDRAGFSPGEIDGKAGRNTAQALAAFTKAGKPAGQAAETLTSYRITAEDVAGPFSESIPRDLMEQSKLPALNYTSALEALAEQFHSSPALLQQLNPSARFAAGETITVPNIVKRAWIDNDPAPDARGAKPPAADASAAKPPAAGAKPATTPQPAVTIVVSKSASTLTVLDEKGSVVFHAPVTSGSEHDPLPLGKWAVTAVSRRPTFHYNPDLFWDANPAHAKAKIPPGPNNPVGLVWIDITREHYGIHGTPEPGKIGHTESHGCVRLTNWDALHVASLVRKGTTVLFER
jgi:lipoprotein-anchoring transpeptidase ErfK/SrfK